MRKDFYTEDVLDGLEKISNMDRYYLLEFYNMGDLRSIINQDNEALKKYTDTMLNTGLIYIQLQKALLHLQENMTVKEK